MKKVAALLVLALAAVALVACGGDNGGTTTTTTSQPGGEAGAAGGGAETGAAEEGAAGGGTTLQFEADPNGGLAYTTEEETAKAGDIKVEFTNPQALEHDVAFEAENGEQIAKTEIVTEGSAGTTLEGIKPGKYAFYCTVPGHRDAGMEGTLIVK